MNKYLTILSKIDWVLVTSVLFLVFFGLTAIYSVALGRALGEFLNFQKQIIWLIIGVAVMLGVALLDYRHWRKLGWVGYWLGVILLILVLTPLGSTIRGTSGWFNLGFFSFQPIEMIKIFLILILADVYSRHSRSVSKLSQLIFVGILVLIPLVLAVIQPDFGSAMVLFFMWLISFAIITKNRWHFLIVMGVVIILLASSWFFIFADYQKDRIKTFLNPSLDPLGRGYNASQSVIAVGAGRLMGRGLGFGSQSQLKFIPESQTDFIFAVIAEELGLVGVLFILLFFSLIFYRLSKIAKRAPDDFGMFIVILVMILLFIHVFINIGMGIGLLPVTGISLPFVSYGGSFLLVMMILLGMVLNIYRSALISRK